MNWRQKYKDHPDFRFIRQAVEMFYDGEIPDAPHIAWNVVDSLKAVAEERIAAATECASAVTHQAHHSATESVQK